MTQLGLIRLLTTTKVMALYGNPPLTDEEAWDIYEEFCNDDRVVFAQEPTGLEDTWKSFALRQTSSPKLWMDAYLAAFAVNAHFQFITTDRAFTQFQGLDALILEARPSDFY